MKPSPATSIRAKNSIRAMEAHMAHYGYLGLMGTEFEDYYFSERRIFFRKLAKDPAIKDFLQHYPGFDEYDYRSLNPYEVILSDMFDHVWLDEDKNEYKRVLETKKVEEYLKAKYPELLKFYIAADQAEPDIFDTIDYLAKAKIINVAGASVLRTLAQYDNPQNFILQELASDLSVHGFSNIHDKKELIGALSYLRDHGGTHPLLGNKDIIEGVLQRGNVESYLKSTYAKALKPLTIRAYKVGRYDLETKMSPVKAAMLNDSKPDAYAIVLGALQREGVITQEKYDALQKELDAIVVKERKDELIRKTHEPSAPPKRTPEGIVHPLLNPDSSIPLVAAQLQNAHLSREYYLDSKNGNMPTLYSDANMRSLQGWHTEISRAKDHYEFVSRFDIPSKIAELSSNFPLLSSQAAAAHGLVLPLKDRAQGQSRHLHLDIRKIKDGFSTTENIQEQYKNSESIFIGDVGEVRHRIFAKNVTLAAEQLFPMMSANPTPLDKRHKLEPRFFGEIPRYSEETPRGRILRKKHGEGTNYVDTPGNPHVESRYGDGTADGTLLVAAHTVAMMNTLETLELVPPFIHPDFTPNFLNTSQDRLKETFLDYARLITQRGIFIKPEQITFDASVWPLERDKKISTDQKEFLQKNIDDKLLTT